MLPSFVTYAHSTAFKQLTYVSGLDPPVCHARCEEGVRACVHVCNCVCVHAYV